MYFYFNLFSVRQRFYNVPLYFNTHIYAHAYICTHVSDARAIVILCKFILQSFAEVRVLHQQNTLNVHHMHTLVFEVFKWNYEQHLYTHISIPMVNRFASLNVPLNYIILTPAGKIQSKDTSKRQERSKFQQ